jgi:protease YdgD
MALRNLARKWPQGLVQIAVWSKRGILAMFVLAIIGLADMLAKEGVPEDPDCPGNASASECEAIGSRQVLDAAQKPWSAIGRIARLQAGAKAHCSGVLIADDLVLTAAHCLWDAAAEKWLDPKDVEFVAGYQKGKSVARSVAREIVVHPDFSRQGSMYEHDPARDRAMLILAEPIGKKAGHMAVHALSFLELVDEESPGSINAIAGYPGTRPETLTLDRRCRIIEKSPKGPDWVIYHTCPMVSGDSGSPLLRIIDGIPHVIAINSAVARADGRMIGIATAETKKSD